MTNSCDPVSTFNKKPFCCFDYFELCNFKRVRRKKHILITTTDTYSSGLLARRQNTRSQDGGNMRLIANEVNR